LSDWIEFSGRIVPMEWGESVYTVLPIPDDIAVALAKLGAKRVEVEINDHALNLALTKSPAIESVFLYTGKSVLREVGVSPGEDIDVRLREADPTQVDVPPDVVQALLSAEVFALWEALTPGKRRGLLHPITSAKRPETRAARISKLLEALGAEV
jgi:hypothetical protein